MKKVLAWTIAALLLLVVGVFLGMPRLARVGGLRCGSDEHARKWRTQLLACHSLEEVKQYFNCFVIEGTAGGGGTTVRVTETVKGRPRALLKSFPDGRWIVCAHADSHGEPGGGTIVSRDSSGEVHMFFGHVCGNLYARGETLEEFYIDLRGYDRVKEVFLKQ
jgi:hypothetical protein